MQKKAYLLHLPPWERWRKTYWIMRNIFFLMIVFQVAGYAKGLSQTINSANYSHSTLQEVFEDLKVQTGYGILYKEEDLQGYPEVTYKKDNIQVEDLLDHVLEDTYLDYRIQDNVIVIFKTDEKRSQQEDGIIKGKVRDSKGEALPGVNIKIAGTNIGSVTNASGEFSLQAPIQEGVIILSFIGFERTEAPFIAGQNLDIVLKESVEGLDEVTVVAYGTQKSREVTGSISSIKSKEIQDMPTANVSNLLQGRVSGMRVTNATGSPGGGGTSIVIRGFNSLSVETERRASDPLWVIDGVPVHSFTSPVTGTNSLSDIDPNDIESIEILKDAASASLYGSRAANGVILVTTKKGKPEESNISVNLSQSFGFKPTMIDVTGGVAERRFRIAQLQGVRTAYRYLTDDGYYAYTDPSGYVDSYENGGQYDLWWNEGEGYDNVALQDSLNPYYNNSTNWFDLYMQASKTTNVNLNLNGGSKTVRYNVGVGYYDEQGVVIGTDYNRLNLLSNFQIKPNDKLDIDLRMYLARTDRGRSTQSGYAGIELMQLDPYDLSTTLPGINSAIYEEALSDMESIIDENVGYRLRSSFNIGYEIIKNLRLSTSASIDYSQAERYYFAPSTISYLDESAVSNQIQKNSMILNENLLTYTLNLNKSKFDFMLGSSFQWDSEIAMNGTAYGGASDQIHWAVDFPELGTDENGEARAMQFFSSAKEEKKLIGMFGRFNYALKSRYLASVTFRRDGSSTFGEDNRWGFFPSGSLGWIVSEESFMKNINAIDFFKIRGSYGKTGLHFYQPYLALGVFAPSSYTFLGQSAIEPNWENGLYNPTLGWEETGQLDLGFDLHFLKRKFEVTFDYYNRQTDNLLAEVVLPSGGSYTGYENQWQNAYAIENEGVELMIKANLVNRKDFFWDLSVNIARNWNRFGGGVDGRDFQSGSTNISIKGQPLNQFYVYKQDGFYETDGEVPIYDYLRSRYYYSQHGSSTYYRYSAGDPKYLDLNGDGEISADDKVAAGSPMPLAQGGIVSTVRWKDFDFNCLFNFSLRKRILNAAAGEGLDVDVNPVDGSAHTSHPILGDLSDYTFWTSAGDDADFARIQADPGKKVYSLYTDDLIEDVNYIRLKSLVVGYTFKDLFNRKDFNARVYASGENLLTLTNYTGRDPEAVDPVYGVDRAQTYPLIRKFTLGLSVNF